MDILASHSAPSKILMPWYGIPDFVCIPVQVQVATLGTPTWYCTHALSDDQGNYSPNEGGIVEGLFHYRHLWRPYQCYSNLLRIYLGSSCTFS
jgi:hypothetical protein